MQGTDRRMFSQRHSVNRKESGTGDFPLSRRQLRERELERRQVQGELDERRQCERQQWSPSDSFSKEFIERVRLSKDASELADKYIEAKVVGKTSRADCQHIAIATLCHADVLVSWNFKHIVNLDRIRGYNGINFQND